MLLINALGAALVLECSKKASKGGPREEKFLISRCGEDERDPKKGERVKYLCPTGDDRDPFAHYRRKNRRTAASIGQAFIRPENQKDSRATPYQRVIFLMSLL